MAAIQVSQVLGADIFVTRPSFLQGVLDITNGRGLDVVLNSLSGELLHASGKCVASYGKIIKLGKRDILGHSNLGMNLFQENRMFCAMDLLQIIKERSTLLGDILRECAQFLKEGKLRPIRPVTMFEAGDITRHSGTCRLGNTLGNLSSACLTSLKWRRSNIADVQRAVGSAVSPIAGVIQMSMVLQNAVLVPKVEGTWSLHQATAELPLDLFIPFSSLSGTFGHFGQANYAAANTFLDAFSQYRNSQWLSCSVVDVGFMGDIGYVAQNLPRQMEFARSGSLHVLEEKDLLQALELPVSKMTTQPFWGSDARFSAWHNALDAQPGQGGEQGEELKKLLEEIENDTSLLYEISTEDKITYEIGRMIASHMSYPDDLKLNELAKITIDSLMTIEIRDWFRRHIGFDISIVEIANAGTVRGLSRTTPRIMQDKHHAGELSRDSLDTMSRGEGTNMGPQEEDELRLCTEDQHLALDLQPIDTVAPAGTRRLKGVLPEVKEVACLVRATDAEAGMRRIKEALLKYSLQFDGDSKILAVPGAVADTALGMEEHVFEYYVLRSNVVFHLAAYANYTLPYSSHRGINVHGTLNMMRFANAKRLKTLHFASSISAYGMADIIAGQMVPEDSTPKFDQKYLTRHIGYTQSKIVAESIAWNAMSNGLPITIYRLGFVSGHSETGVCKPEDSLNPLAANCIRISHFPTVPIARNQFIPVDFVCAAMLRLFLCEDNLRHAFNITFDQFSILGAPPLIQVSPQEWIKKFTEYGDKRARHGATLLLDNPDDYRMFWGLDTASMALYETTNLHFPPKGTLELIDE
ncbi:male sterility protein-domain-containing protein [Aspergillus germanicus]